MDSLQQTPPTPEVIVNAPRFNKLNNNPLYHSTKDKTTITAVKALPSARKLGFGMPSETKTSRLRAAQQKAKEAKGTADQKTHHNRIISNPIQAGEE